MDSCPSHDDVGRFFFAEEANSGCPAQDHERKLIKKVKDLNNEIVNNASKVHTALKLSQDDQQTITTLRAEVEKAWKMVRSPRLEVLWCLHFLGWTRGHRTMPGVVSFRILMLRAGRHRAVERNERQGDHHVAQGGDRQSVGSRREVGSFNWYTGRHGPRIDRGEGRAPAPDRGGYWYL